jgi:3-methylcrotonyl-CoA carboxylase beta subunit
VDLAECAHLGHGRRAGRQRPGHGRRDALEARGESWPSDEEEAFKAPIRDQYESQGHPYYATARLWDDGVIDPADTRRVLGLALAAAANAPIERERFGVFRM